MQKSQINLITFYLNHYVCISVGVARGFNTSGTHQFDQRLGYLSKHLMSTRYYCQDGVFVLTTRSYDPCHFDDSRCQNVDLNV